MIDQFVANPILLLDNLLAYARYGLGVKFAWNGSATPLRQAEALMRAYGIRVYGRGLTGDQRSFRVRSAQARWAEYLLLRAGSPMTQRPRHPANRRVQPGPLPPAWGVPARGVGLAGAFVHTALRRKSRQP